VVVDVDTTRGAPVGSVLAVEPVLCFPNPPSTIIAKALDVAGYPWVGAVDAGQAERLEPVDGWTAAVICAGEFCAATVRIVGFSSAGCAVLQRRFSGAASDKFQRFGCGQPPADGIVESTV